MTLSRTDPDVAALLQQEEQRQREQVELIASENYVSRAVLDAVGSVFMNKYTEGYPGKKYYQGNVHYDALERLCQERALAAFHLAAADWGVNVQAPTGSVANFAVLSALLTSGDTILSLRLTDGGHLSHGWQLSPTEQVTLVSKLYRPVFYGVDPATGLLDYEQVETLAKEHHPKLIISGGTAYAREIDHEEMRRIADSVGALYLADIAHEAGLIAAGVNASPFPFADVVTMTTRKTLRGPIGALIVARRELSERIDRAVFPGMLGGPLNHTIAGIAVALREAATPAFAAYARQVIANARTLAAELSRNGFQLVSGGTDKHLVLIDLRNRKVTGYQLAVVLEAVNITTNKNTVPQETRRPWNPSGIRLGTPKVTSRGFREPDMQTVAAWISRATAIAEREFSGFDVAQTREALRTHAELQELQRAVATFAAAFPVPGIDDAQTAVVDRAPLTVSAPAASA
jgi:glycine hydroxymethyltransferase